MLELVDARYRPVGAVAGIVQVGGIVVVEEIFNIPGIGRELLVAVAARDLPAIQGGVLILAATYCVVNFIADLTYAYLDRRIQYA